MTDNPCVKCANYERCKKWSYNLPELLLKKRLIQIVVFGKDCYTLPSKEDKE